MASYPLRPLSARVFLPRNAITTPSTALAASVLDSAHLLRWAGLPAGPADGGSCQDAETRIDISLRQFLTDGYDLKAVAAYEIDPETVISVEDAKGAIETSNRFVECITALLGAP